MHQPEHRRGAMGDRLLRVSPTYNLRATQRAHSLPSQISGSLPRSLFDSQPRHPSHTTVLLVFDEMLRLHACFPNRLLPGLANMQNKQLAKSHELARVATTCTAGRPHRCS
jgi:hypothetical protein